MTLFISPVGFAADLSPQGRGKGRTPPAGSRLSIASGPRYKPCREVGTTYGDLYRYCPAGV